MPKVPSTPSHASSSAPYPSSALQPSPSTHQLNLPSSSLPAKTPSKLATASAINGSLGFDDSLLDDEDEQPPSDCLEYDQPPDFQAARDEEQNVPQLAPPAPTGPYKLSFGKNAGLTLHDIAPSYISWIVTNRVYEGKEDLKEALVKERFMTEGGMELPAPERPAAVAGEEKKEEEGLSAASEAAKKVALGGWTCPTNVVKGVRGFSSKVKEGEQSWILLSDAIEFFGLNRSILKDAGIAPVPFKDSFFYLYQVYHFAKFFPHLLPTALQNTQNSATTALAAFLVKDAAKIKEMKSTWTTKKKTTSSYGGGGRYGGGGYGGGGSRYGGGAYGRRW
ncbi:hypothetical protein BDY24DRAFT_389821 [Mrakia frigida]|uniref:uncharacterized protein n=1 Tax=Mrakia frigida TaxID=29902 RepID=UPI003FCC189A